MNDEKLISINIVHHLSTFVIKMKKVFSSLSFIALTDNGNGANQKVLLIKFNNEMMILNKVIRKNNTISKQQQ